jgi:carbonic anhydrase
MIRPLRVLLILAFVAGCQRAEQVIATPDQAEEVLREGNRRFASDHPRHPHSNPYRRHETATEGQHPFAIVVACSDSRVPVELLFDQGVGDIFVIRVAGNVCDMDEAGSIEYAVEHLGTPLVVVLGHSQCGAVKAVVEGAHEHGNLERLIAHIRPAVDAVRAREPSLTGEAFLDAAVRQNIWHSIEDLRSLSPDVRSLVAVGKLRVVGAMYDIDSAQVEWLGTQPG